MGSGPINDPPPSGPGRLWDKHDLAAYWGVPVGQVTKLITKRKCPPVIKVGKHIRFNPAEVVAYTAGLREKPATVKPGTPPVLGLVPTPASKRGVAA